MADISWGYCEKQRDVAQDVAHSEAEETSALDYELSLGIRPCSLPEQSDTPEVRP